MTLATEPLPPRPQLIRPQWSSLDGPWSFYAGEVEPEWTSDIAAVQTITVPYPPESPLSGIGDRQPMTTLWYRRELDLARPADGRRVLLHFGAVDHRATVWLNGRLQGSHEGGHTPFEFDITDDLVDSVQVLTVRAEDPVDDPYQPRGKQDWLPRPHAIWYHRTTGIWQPVWWEEVSAAHIAHLDWSSDLTASRVRLRAELTGAGGVSAIRVRLTLGEELIAEITSAVMGSEVSVDIPIVAAEHGQHSGRLQWSPEHPNLIDARVELLDHSGELVDRVSSYVGYRSAGCADGRFLLNGLPYYLRMALQQGYWPQSQLAAPDEAALRREVELAKAMGLNGIRIHQKVEDPRYLYWCDRLGLLVWAEMPSAYAFGTKAIERVVDEWTEVVRRDRSHPCVVTWVPLNESWGVPQIAAVPQQQDYARALYHLTKALDPTRPVISNDGWEHTGSDIWGVHDYASHGAVLTERYRDAERIERVLRERRPGRRRVLLGEQEHRGQPVMLTEFGGLSYLPDAGEEWFGYSTVATVQEYEERLTGLIGAVLGNPELAGFCYTQFADTEQERNGLLTADREPKIPLERLHAMISRPASAIPAEEIDANRRRAARSSERAAE